MSLNLEMLDNIFGPSENVVVIPEKAIKKSEAPSFTPDLHHLHRFNVGQWHKNDVYGLVLDVERGRDLPFNLRNLQPANDDLAARSTWPQYHQWFLSQFIVILSINCHHHMYK